MSNSNDENGNAFERYDYESSEQHRMHRRAMAHFDQLTDQEKFETLVEIGILNEKGELTERYGGEAPNPED